MKLWSTRLGILTIPLIAGQAVAQTSDQVANMADQGAGIIAWVVVGLVGGYLASKVVNRTGEGTLRDILLGVVGGVIGGIIFRTLGGHGVTGINLWSILVAFVGAVVVLVLYHLVAGQRAA